MHVTVDSKVVNPAVRTPRAQSGRLVAPVVSGLYGSSSGVRVIW